MYIRISQAGNRGTRSREEGERVRVAQLERSIVFLKQQHVETLQQLHSETERLKRENRGQLSGPARSLGQGSSYRES